MSLDCGNFPQIAIGKMAVNTTSADAHSLPVQGFGLAWLDRENVYTGLRLTTPKHNFVACDWFIIFPMFGFRTCQLAFCKQKTCQTDKIDVFINVLVTYD